MAKTRKLKAALLSQQARLKQREQAAGAVKAQQSLQSGKAVPKGKQKSHMLQTIPFKLSDRILLVGEGNFSFALAILKHPALAHFPPENITATSYDSEEDCIAKYPDAAAIVAELKRRGSEVLFGIDATTLHKYKGLRERNWNRIVWNFPHAGKSIADQDRNIRVNQELLLRFLRSAAPVLARGPLPSYSRPHVPSSDVDSGSGEDDDKNESPGSPTNLVSRSSRGTILITLRNVHPYTAWDLPNLAKKPPPPDRENAEPNPSFKLLRSFRFQRKQWPGYQHKMTKGERAAGTGTTGVGGEDRTWEFCLWDRAV